MLNTKDFKSLLENLNIVRLSERKLNEDDYNGQWISIFKEQDREYDNDVSYEIYPTQKLAFEEPKKIGAEIIIVAQLSNSWEKGENIPNLEESIIEGDDGHYTVAIGISSNKTVDEVKQLVQEVIESNFPSFDNVQLVDFKIGQRKLTESEIQR